MKRISVTVLQALSIVLLLGVLSVEMTLAQAPGTSSQQPGIPGEWVSLTIVSVKPEMMVEFQNFMRSTTNPALRKGGLKWRSVWQSTSAAGDAFEFVIVSPIATLAEFDGPSHLEKGLGKEGFAAWQAKAGSFVNSVRRFVVRTRPDLSVEGKMTGPPKLAVVHAAQITPGRGQDYENYLKNDFLPAMKKAGATYMVSQTVFGGDANEYVSLTLRENFAEIAKGPVLVLALGPEEARKVMEKMPSGVVIRQERTFARFVPELSFME